MLWILINLSLEKDEYWSVLFARSTLPHVCLRAPLWNIICLCKLETKIQSQEELIEIMACYYFNINLLFSLSYCCMPSCHRRMTLQAHKIRWWHGVDEQWGQAGCLRAQGSGRLPQSEHPSVPAWQKSMGLWMGCQGVGCKYLHSSMHPPSPYPRIRSPNLPPGSSSGFSLGHLCWVEESGGAVVWPRVLCLPAEWKGGFLQKKTCWYDSGHCYHKGNSGPMSYLEQLLTNTSLDWI